jgi:signal transduction histidine kinase
MGEIFDLGTLRLILNTLPEILLVVNSRREVIYANDKFLSVVGIENIGDILPVKPGNFFKCVNAMTPGSPGCGKTAGCEVCGLHRAITESPDGTARVRECRISRDGDAEPMDIRVWARTARSGDEAYTVVSVSDISDEKRRHALERIFFHDVLNMAGGVRGAVQYLQDPGITEREKSEILTLLDRLSDFMADEINAQKQLLQAEKGELEVRPEPCRSLTELDRAVEIYRGHDAAAGKSITLEPGSESVHLLTDRTILRRILGNMLKNALEATPQGGIVRASCRRAADGHKVEFRIHNDTAMSEDARLQVFQRSFSTKGAGRGLGTYSIKMLTERYLKGRASFESAEGLGTDFLIRLDIQS